eukprot:10603146-Alexandrium_andersonii.AAC.1
MAARWPRPLPVLGPGRLNWRRSRGRLRGLALARTRRGRRRRRRARRLRGHARVSRRVLAEAQGGAKRPGSRGPGRRSDQLGR